MAGRRIRDEHDARECLAQAAASRLDRAAWARSHGVNPRSLNAWRINLERGATSGGGMVELVTASAGEVPAARYTVRLGGFAVDVGPDFDEHVLARLLGVVASCC